MELRHRGRAMRVLWDLADEELLRSGQLRARPATSPTQTIGVKSVFQRGVQLLVDGLIGLAKILATFGVAEDDVRDSDRVSIGAEISPVNAPSSAKCIFCAPTEMPLPERVSRTILNEIAGGQMTISSRA